jgi:hypothetical protein
MDNSENAGKCSARLKTLSLVLSVLFVVGRLHPAAAQALGQDYEGGNDGYRMTCNTGAPRSAIVACTHIINDRHEDADRREMALQNRGFYYNSIGDVDHAIADYTSVLKLSSGRRNKAKVYLNLGLLGTAHQLSIST